jgi:hypothetical protein
MWWTGARLNCENHNRVRTNSAINPRLIWLAHSPPVHLNPLFLSASFYFNISQQAKAPKLNETVKIPEHSFAKGAAA